MLITDSIRKRNGEPLVLVAVDFLSLALANAVYYYIRVFSGLFRVVAIPDFWGPLITLSLFVMFVFWFWGLYRYSRLHSRFDELSTVAKASAVAVIILFFAIFFDDATNGRIPHFRLLVVIYWGLVVFCAGGARVFLRTFQRNLIIKGYGVHNALIVGTGRRAVDVYNLTLKYKALGYKPVGFVTTTTGATITLPAPVVGKIDNLENVIKKSSVQELIIALEENDREQLYGILSGVNSANVSVKMVPDLHDAVSGQVRVGQLYGFPLIEIMPQIMQPWEEATKRTLDVVFSLVLLAVGLPVWVIVAIAVKIESRGPSIYKQDRVGQDGRAFTLYKFRSMFQNAETLTGPTWADKNDPRITRIGRMIRKLHLDEVPQFINVLKGDMSLIGPRPERPYFVEQLSKEIPLYRRRLKVKPGITGWAQIKHTYDQSIDDVKIKLQYDLFYIENMSLRMDFKIALSTIVHMLSGKGHA
ncbi:MAG: sugar transferase [Bacteroidetes bacterium]|nr:sugar transferase [Bacteroidota bacterium]